MKAAKWLTPIVGIILFSLSSCGEHSVSKEEKPIVRDSISGKPAPLFDVSMFSGKVFFFGPELDKNCQVQAYCDCCAYDMLFIDGSRFVLIDHCMPATTYSKGTYTIRDSLLLLKTGGICVSYEPDWDQTDTLEVDNPPYKYTTEQTKSHEVAIKIGRCGDHILLRIEEDFGTTVGVAELREYLEDLKKEGILKKLKL